MSTFKLHVNRRGPTTHPYLTFPNPTESIRQIVEHTTQNGSSNPRTYAEHHKAGAKYTFATGAHGCGIRVDLTTGDYMLFLDELKRNLHYLDGFGKPRDLVVRYGASSKAEETCMSITEYLEGHYQHDREGRTITFFPKDGTDVLYVMELVNQYADLMNLVRKEIVVHRADAEYHIATGVFQEISDFTSVPHVFNRGQGGVRFLCMTEDQYRNVSDELMAYKVAYVMDEWK